MAIKEFPSPRTPLENSDDVILAVVKSVISELQSYPSGIPLDSIISYLECDYENWRDILRSLLGYDEISIIDDIVLITQ